MASNATTAIYIDRSYSKAKTKGSLISIRVTFERRHKYYATPFSLTVDDFEKVISERPRQPFKDIALQLQAFEKKASDIIRDLPTFTFDAFEKRFLTNRIEQFRISNAFEEYAKDLRENNQIGTAVSYECAKNSLNQFFANANFSDVTVDFLNKYENWMLAKGNSVTTVGIYLRQLRALFNKAIGEDLIKKEQYPFGKRKYEIPTSKNTKKALSLPVIEQIFNYQAKENSTVERSRDYWLFIYQANGINVKDVCLLKYANIKGNFIEFERAKTSRTKRAVEPIKIVLTDHIRNIIDKHGNQDKTPGNYIFPILSKGLTATRQRQLIQQITALINDHMKAIAAALKIETKITTYVARHSFATVLKRSGLNISFIKEALGHSAEKTTENYLAGFEDDIKIEAAKALTNFRKQF